MLNNIIASYRLIPQDINDQIPVFSGDPYELDVTEDTGEGSILLTVRASDADIGQNAALRYSVDSDVVAVDVGTGEVELVTMLDYEINSRLDIEV